jgi:hypothetical protein
MRMMRGTGQYFLYDSARSPSSALVLFLDDVYLKPGFYIFSVLAIHTIMSAPFSSHSARISCACLALAGASLDNKLLISTALFVS